MSKSVYSIVLDDEIIKGIDLMAMQQGTSRSNLINRILAQQVCMPTAETIINDVYNSIDTFLQGHSSLALQLPGNGSLISMRSALQYKYNPSVKYTLELYEKSSYGGQLKVSMRSQNSTLIEILDSFFYLWSQLEMQYCGITEQEFSIGGGRYSRLLRSGYSSDFEQYGRNIALYVELLDKCMKEYFSSCGISLNNANINVTQLYLSSLNRTLAQL